MVYSLKRNLQPSSYWNLYTSTIADIRSSSANTVTVRLKQPDSLFLWLMTLPVGAVGKKAYIEQKGKAYGTASALPIGTGPLSVASWQSGRQINLKRFAAYWDPANAAKVENLTMVFIGNDADLTQSLLAGDVDGTYAAPASSVPVLEQRRARIALPRSLSAQCRDHSDAATGSAAGPTSTPRLVSGHRSPFDRLEGLEWHRGPVARDGSIRHVGATSRPIPPCVRRTSHCRAPTPDVAKARQLLNAAGAKGQHVTLTVQNDSLSQNTALLLSEAAHQIGLNVTLKVDTIQNVLNLFYDAKARESTDAFYYVDYADVPHPMDLYIQYMLPPAPTNYNYAFHNAAAGRWSRKPDVPRIRRRRPRFSFKSSMSPRTRHPISQSSRRRICCT